MAGKPCGIHRHFNPRTHEECDRLKVIGQMDTVKFQSTHSRGVRPGEITITLNGVAISIHALTRSATCSGCRFKIQSVRFQSTHSRGVRRVPKGHPDLYGFNFNPRTHEECDTHSAQSAKDCA